MGISMGAMVAIGIGVFTAIAMGLVIVLREHRLP